MIGERVRIIQRTKQNITPNKWVLSLLKSISLRLHGQTFTLRIADASDHSFYLKMAKGILGPLYLDKLDLTELNGIIIKEVDDPQKKNDLVLQVDWSGYQEPNPLHLTYLRKLLHIWVKDISFNDWNSTSNIQIRWVKYGLAIRIPFESTGSEVSITKLGITVHGNINGFYLDLHLVPYIFWFPDIAAAKDRDGKEFISLIGWPTKEWASGRGIYKQRCAVFVDFDWSSFSPNIYDAENKARNKLTDLVRGIPLILPQKLLFQVFEALIIGEKNIVNLSAPSKLRGIDIKPNDARFMYMDEEVETFKGKGKIVAVRKDNTSNHLDEDRLGILTIRKDIVPDTIIEVEVEDVNGERSKISTLNLAESIIDGDAEIENAHVVIRQSSNWGKVAMVNVPWKHLVDRDKDIMRPWGRYGATVPGADLRYNGYLRSNPDKNKVNNLDNLPTYTYDKLKPLERNLYDGTFFYVYPDLTPFQGLVRTLFPRAWKLPTYYDRETKLLNSWI